AGDTPHDFASTVVPGTSIARRDSDLYQLLSLAGLCLVGVYALSVAWEAWPVQLLRPQWVLRQCGSLRNGASFPLVGVCLLLIGRHLDNNGSTSIGLIDHAFSFLLSLVHFVKRSLHRRWWVHILQLDLVDPNS
ncbi:MAG: hypothetical protein ACO3VB_03085, partial [Opitutales bacterium]